jgi:hypothetical protein
MIDHGPRNWGYIPRKGKKYLYFTAPRLALGPNQPPIQCVSEILSRWGRDPGAWSSPPNTEVKMRGAMPPLLHTLFEFVKLHTEFSCVVTAKKYFYKEWRMYRSKRQSANILGRIAYLLLIRYGPHRKWRVQPFFYCCVCIRCRCNVFTEPSNRNVHIQTHRLMGRIYKVRRWDGLKCHDIHTKFHKDWSRHSKVGTGRYIDRKVIA